MEVKASAKYIAISPKKSRPIAKLLKNKKIDQAMAFLQFEIKYAALPISKLIKAAVASAEEKGLDKDRLFIKSLTVDGGPVGKKQRIRARGRADLQKRRTSHITVILEEEKVKKDKKIVENVKIKNNNTKK